jgi:hypothetical protein
LTQIVLKEFVPDRDFAVEQLSKALTQQIRTTRKHPNIETVSEFFTSSRTGVCMWIF